METENETVTQGVLTGPETTGYFTITRITRQGRFIRRESDLHHVQEIDHRYGPSNSRTWGKTLCGLKGRGASSLDYTIKEAAEGTVGGHQVCLRCTQAAQKRAGL